MEAPYDSTKSKVDLLNFSGSASDMLAAMQVCPPTHAQVGNGSVYAQLFLSDLVQTSVRRAHVRQAAGIVMPDASEAALKVAVAPASAPAACEDPGCTHDHSHGGHDHHHGHAAISGAECLDPTRECKDPTHNQSHSHEHCHKEPTAAAAAVITGAMLEAKLRAAMPVAHVECTDKSDGCGAKFNVVVVSSAFDGNDASACALLPFLRRAGCCCRACAWLCWLLITPLGTTTRRQAALGPAPRREQRTGGGDRTDPRHRDEDAHASAVGRPATRPHGRGARLGSRAALHHRPYLEAVGTRCLELSAPHVFVLGLRCQRWRKMRRRSGLED